MNIILPKYFTSEIYFNLLLNILDLKSVALYITMNTVCYRYSYSGRPYTDRFVSPPKLPWICKTDMRCLRHSVM